MRTKQTLNVSLCLSALSLFALSNYRAGSQATMQSTETIDDHTAGSVRTDSLGIKQVWVPEGCFTMGTDDAEAMMEKLNAPSWVRRTLGYEAPAHEVCLTEGYWIDQFEVIIKYFVLSYSI